MVKGINKQIIEIKCTNNEQFEKILLFVRADSLGKSNSELCREAYKLIEAFDEKSSENSFKLRKPFSEPDLPRIITIILLGMLGLACLALAILLIF